MQHADSSSRLVQERALEPPVPQVSLAADAPLRALTAAAAGAYLAALIGLDAPIPARKMWALARSGAIHVIRINRTVMYQTTTLQAFAASGGTPRKTQRAKP